MALSFFISGFGSKDYSSEQLYALYRDSADTAFLQQLITLHGDALYYYLLRQSDRQLAEDISQQCWLKLLEQPDGFGGNSSFKTWLFTVARHCLIDELRRRSRWLAEDITAPLVDTTTCPLQQLNVQQQQQRWAAQLNALPFLQREALMLQLEGFTLAQISQITAQGEETVKSRLRYAKQMLQQLNGASNEQA
ncbi:RNA polymerase sigma factor [Rheinheimera pleomorphica]|uniref:RNA polymerase sigma factor n=1 Tax=Rheinheimera pleomorphica TaxID=2703963 RepID=UPI00141EA103|nr:sigma-70 family RNA polymerase sigma factor [Rheinheimera pleomorphica]